MELISAFKQINQSGNLWQTNDRVLLAVSGGVDSMVLLELWQQLPKEKRPEFAVAHVNHQLREESALEEEFLRNYCAQRAIPFYCYRWEEGPSVTSHVESRARKVRYAFFQELVKTEKYAGVVTAHHGDDQGETFLMKVIRGSQLQNLVSMAPVSQRQGLTIFRPLLPFAKIELSNFAQEWAVPYQEDPSNSSSDYLRNRLRQELMPHLKAENDNFLQHIHNLVKQIEYANSIITEVTLPLRQKIINQVSPQTWQFDITLFQALSSGQQYMLLVSFFQDVLIEQGVVLQEAHLTAVQTLLASHKAHGQVVLPSDWEMVKSYELAYLQMKEEAVPALDDEVLTLLPEEGGFVSETEYFYLMTEGQTPMLPATVSEWSATELLLKEEISQFPLTVRRAAMKERFVINQQGNTKEIRRLLIDEKVPRMQREKVWVVQNQRDLLWIVPIRKSYLSIRKETDKIHYRLIYLKR